MLIGIISLPYTFRAERSLRVKSSERSNLMACLNIKAKPETAPDRIGASCVEDSAMTKLFIFLRKVGY